ncbi:sugar phosphate nucleotidyltransferase [Anaerosporobacter faecicola]|uniref:sugar phosphate nucleotidyltransferase n=1 Tax=Anaerosporobacter faecicola TaxID=2718714 RepID=UPI00143BD4F5|nr:sugar phosphate nucleotidyltransferase [Anaerosporobacter faecicola]
MTKPVLVIMAAGMGSRYGGLKQMDPIDPQGHKIIDFSIYDAKRAGFEKVIFVIKKELEKDFRELVGNPIAKHMEVEYVFQNLAAIPEGFQIPEGRVKPWGTGHAVLSCLQAIKGPFAVINADDYYGVSAFKMIYQYLCEAKDDTKYRYTMVGYRLKNTVTENGYVSRGICVLNTEQMLQGIVERTRIETMVQGIAYTEDEGKTYHSLAEDTIVSMNMWGFTQGMLEELRKRFAFFLKEEVPNNPLKAEYFLPSVVDQLLKEERATVKVLNSEDKWYGVTYKEDKESVVQAVAQMKANGMYPDELWR